MFKKGKARIQEGKIKVKCLTTLNMEYFAGENYTVDNEFYEQNKDCFIPYEEEEFKIMTTADIDEVKAPKKKKEPEVDEETEAKPEE